MIKPAMVNERLRDVPAELRTFLVDYFAGDRIRLSPPKDNVLRIAGSTSIVLYREPPFQVELVVVDPGFEIPSHVHDDVDAFEVAVAGDIDFFVDEVQCGYVRGPRADGRSRDLGRFFPVRSDAWHRGKAGPKGATFLSVQRWKNGVQPTHVALNWRGPTMGPEHERQL